MNVAACRPGLRLGQRPEKRTSQRRPSALDRALLGAHRRLLGSARDARALRRDLSRLDACMDEFEAQSPEALAERCARLRARISRGGHDDDSLNEALALASTLAGTTLGLSPRRPQREAAWAMLRGRVVELDTGEGKTLATALAAAVTALDGTPVHVATANEYLAARDAAQLAPLYSALGLRSAAVIEAMDDDARRSSYAADVVHATGKQFAFDDLRDSLGAGSRRGFVAERLAELAEPGKRVRLMRGLCAMFVDEIDAVLVDEARLPLVLAEQGAVDTSAETEAAIALVLARSLREGTEFHRHGIGRRVRLSVRGQETLAARAKRLDGPWRLTRYREQRVEQALVALHGLRRDHDYLVTEDRLVLLDPSTGRPAPDRTLQHGLQRMLELKERCAISVASEVRLATSFQRFFSRYLRLAGTSGTVAETAAELNRFYDIRSMRVEPSVPSRRVDLGTRVLADRGSQLSAMHDVVERMSRSGRPVLIGTASVEQTRAVARYLAAVGLDCATLDASCDQEEADIVAVAGRAGQITVATRMAGRGTDILLDDAARVAGGLHVLSLALNESRRLDRQLAGRAARQGDPGSFEAVLSLDDERLVEHLPDKVRDLVAIASTKGRGGAACARLAVRFVQNRIERGFAGERLALFRQQDPLERQLAFAGPIESNPA